ncbi:Methyltransferase-like protein 13 [Trebouxia sp. C0009 RCD-2024]
MYGAREYWECRYHDDPVIGHCQRKGVLSNEWYLQYEMLKTFLHKHVSADDHVLIPGCGLSLLGEQMAADGYKSLLAVDYSETCIQTMQARGAQEHQNNVTYSLMDVTALQLEYRTVAWMLLWTKPPWIA